jgi:hypothetical protein
MYQFHNKLCLFKRLPKLGCPSHVGCTYPNRFTVASATEHLSHSDSSWGDRAIPDDIDFVKWAALLVKTVGIAWTVAKSRYVLELKALRIALSLLPHNMGQPFLAAMTKWTREGTFNIFLPFYIKLSTTFGFRFASVTRAQRELHQFVFRRTPRVFHVTEAEIDNLLKNLFHEHYDGFSHIFQSRSAENIGGEVKKVTFRPDATGQLEVGCIPSVGGYVAPACKYTTEGKHSVQEIDTASLTFILTTHGCTSGVCHPCPACFS